MQTDATVGLPRFVMLELTNACDLACRHCPFHGDGVEKQRPVGHMAPSLWRSALAEIRSWGTAVEVQPWGMGEPLLSPDLWDVVRTVKQSPGLRAGFYTNGNQWTGQSIEQALTSGLDWVTFSIDGLRREVFEHYRVGADFDQVLGALRGLAAARRQRRRRLPEIRVNMVEYEELAGHGDEFVAEMRGLADTVMVSRFREVGNRRFSPIDLPRVPCYQLDTMLAVGWDGRIFQCCEDQQGQAAVGRYPERSLREIWYGERLAELRAAHRAGEYGVSALCQDCDAWTGIYERESSVDSVRVRERTATTVFEFDPSLRPER